MKKLLSGLGICFFLFILCIYIFIPNYVLSTAATTIVAKRDPIFRNLVKEENWTKWWPGNFVTQKNTSPQDIFLFNNRTYSIESIQISSLTISIAKNNSVTKTSLLVLPDGQNVKLFWEGKMYATLNPLTRIQTYFESKELNKDMNTILKTMQFYLSKNENIYGINVFEEPVMDSILLFKDATSKGFPATSFIYGLINDLRTYISNNSAKETGFPMLNIYTSDSINYSVKVAVPVDRILPEAGHISTRFMPGRRIILATQVKGSYPVINKALEQLKIYANDNTLVSPAIPFQSMITDRSKEPDSTKWITRIYYPIMK